MPLFGMKFFGSKRKAREIESELKIDLVKEKAKEILDASKEQGVPVNAVKLSRSVTRAAGISATHHHGFGAFFGGGGAGG
jgi:hypothetical protein